MRWTLIAGLVAVLSVVPARSTRADEFSEFRIPSHSWSFAAADFDASASRNRSSSVQSGGRSNALLRGNLAATWAYDSDAWLRAISVSGSFQGTSASLDRGDDLTSLAADLRSERLGESLRISAESRTYPWEFPLGIEVDAIGFAGFEQGWYADDRRITQGDSLALQGSNGSQWSYQYSLTVEAAAGLGRVRDATGVYRAFVLERRLQRFGILSRALSQAARERIAALYYVEPRYDDVFDRPGKSFWKDLENILVADGVLGPGGLDAYAVLLAMEPVSLSEPALLRRSGFFIGPTISGTATQAIVRDHAEFNLVEFRSDSLTNTSRTVLGGRRTSKGDNITYGMTAELHRPVGVRLQTDARSTIRFPKVNSTSFNFASRVVFTYLVADRWEASGTFEHQRYLDVTRDFSTWRARTSAEIAYYLEDRTRVSLRAESDQLHFSSNTGRSSFDRADQISLGITYHFSRGLSAPGLFESHHPEPPSEPLY